MKRSTYAIAVAALCGVPLFASAADSPYGSVMGVYHFPDATRQSDEGYGGRIVFGVPIAPYVATEFNAFRTGSDQQAGGKDFYSGTGLDFVFGGGTRGIAPFLLLGGGYHWDEVPGPNESSGYANAGGGLLFNLGGSRDAAIRVEGRRIAVFNDDLSPGRDRVYDTQIGLGFQMALGAKPPPPVEPPPPPPPPPAPPPKPMPPPDSDGDGVADDKDACPNSIPGIRVDSRGCAIKAQVIELRDVNFEFNKATLTPDSRSVLDGIAKSLAGQPTMEIRIEGHTDSIGTDAYNLRLSKARAASVRDYLISRGVTASRLSSEGFGESRPVADNGTDEGRAMNRRVELKVEKE